MAEQPIFPDESNMERFRDFANVQQEISEHLRVQKHLYEQIGRINRDVEDRVIKRRQAEFRMLNIIQGQNVKYNDLVAKRVKAKSWEVKDLEGQISSTLQLIQYNRTLIDLSKLASENEIAMAKKQHEEGNRWFKFAGGEIQKMLGLDLKQFEAVKATGDKMMLLGNVTEGVAYTWGAILMFVKGAYDLFNKMDVAAWDFRKAMGMTRIESAVIRKDAQRIAIDYMGIGVTIESVYKSYQALGQTVGGVHNVTKSMAEDVTIMAAQFGISEEASARFLRNLAVISKSSMESQTNMMYMAQDMSSAAGVQLSEVMGDVATKSSKTLLLMSRLPNIALRTAIELRRMGTSMNTAANAGAHVLNFSESINEEMTASVLLGRSINMQNIRQLTYARNLEGAAKATVALAQKHGFATKMDYFQMQAFARMTGYSEEQLLNMVQTSEQLEKIRRSGTPQQQEQLALYEKMRMENEMAAKARATDSSALLRTMNNQTRLVAISAKWNQILAQAQELLLPVVDFMLAMVIPAMDIARGMFAWTGALRVISPLMGGVVSLFDKIIVSYQSITTLLGYEATLMDKILYPVGKIAWYIGEWSINGKKAFSSLSWVAKIKGWFSPLTTLGKVFGTIGGWFMKIGGWFGKIFAPLGKITGAFGKFAGFIGFFGKWIPILGWIITAFQFIGNLIARMKGIGDAFNAGFFHGIWFGLKAIVGALYDTLIKPFADAFKWIWHFFGGNSPSLLGIGIVKGIVGIGSMLIKAITLPWRLAFVAITKLGPWVGKMIWKGITMYFNMWKTLGTVVYNGAKYLGQMVLNGISSVKDRIVEVLKHPFQSAWQGVKKLWGGHSPSEIGLSIVRGLQAVGKDIHGALADPFQTALSEIMNKIPGFGKVAKGLAGKYQGLGKSLEARATAAYIPAVTVTPNGTTIESAKNKATDTAKQDKNAIVPMLEETGLKICALLEKILSKDNSLYIDGSLLSTTLARNISFRSSFGTNH